MFKKILFVFVLAAAVLAFAGYSVPTASACSTSVLDDCRPIFGPNFDAIQPVPSQAVSAPTNMSSSQSTVLNTEDKATSNSNSAEAQTDYSSFPQ